MRQRVLVVEDDANNRTLIRIVLEQEGYVVEEAPDGECALALLRASEGRLVVLVDLRMPTMDGTHLLQAVEAEKELATRHAYIVVTASQDAASPQVQALRAHLHAPLLEKPFDVDHLLGMIAEVAAQFTCPARTCL